MCNPSSSDNVAFPRLLFYFTQFKKSATSGTALFISFFHFRACCFFMSSPFLSWCVKDVSNNCYRTSSSYGVTFSFISCHVSGLFMSSWFRLDPVRNTAPFIHPSVIVHTGIFCKWRVHVHPFQQQNKQKKITVLLIKIRLGALLKGL